MMKRNVFVMMGIMMGSCVAATGPAWAQMQPAAAQPQQSEVDENRAQIMQQINSMQARARVLNDRINTIAQKAQAQNPDIQKLYSDMTETYKQKLAEYGYPSEAEIQKLREMQQRLQAPGAGDMDETERQQLTEQFNAELVKLQASQEKAQRDTDVLAAQQAFGQARSKAMSEIDPEAPTLERELENVQGKLEQLRQQFQQVLQPPKQ